MGTPERLMAAVRLPLKTEHVPCKPSHSCSTSSSSRTCEIKTPGVERKGDLHEILQYASRPAARDRLQRLQNHEIILFQTQFRRDVARDPCVVHAGEAYLAPRYGTSKSKPPFLGIAMDRTCAGIICAKPVTSKRSCLATDTQRPLHRQDAHVMAHDIGAAWARELFVFGYEVVGPC